MTATKTMRIIRLQDWARQIEECRKSGMTVGQWCDQTGISVKNYYYRMKRVREELLDALETGNTLMVDSNQAKQIPTPVFAAIPAMKRNSYTTAVTVQIGTYIAEINNGADLKTVEGVLRTLTRL